jgi:nucleoside 2-deoxyribosyltransferase
VRRLLETAHGVLNELGVEAESLALDFAPTSAERSAPRAAMLTAFAMIDTADGLLVLQASPRRSEGMLMEVGYAIARGKQVIVAAHSSAKPSYLPDMADIQLRWSTLDDLAEALRGAAWPALAQTA